MVPTWTSNGQEWVFLPNPAAPSGTTADTTGASDGTRLKGPGTGNTNGLTLSPDGGTVIMNGVMAMGQLAVGGIRLIDPTNFTQYASPSKGGIS